jgi:hypothetical protein
MRRVSKTGIALSILYMLAAATLFTEAFFTIDVKSTYVLKQAAAIPAMVFFGVLRMEKIIFELPVLNNFYFMTIFSLILVYAVGHGLGFLGSLVRRLFTSR